MVSRLRVVFSLVSRPEIFCWVLFGRRSRSGSPDALLRRGPFRTGQASFPAPGSSEPDGSRAGSGVGRLLSPAYPVPAVGVQEILFRLVRRAVSGVGDRFLGDRFADGAQPLL